MHHRVSVMTCHKLIRQPILLQLTSFTLCMQDTKNHDQLKPANDIQTHARTEHAHMDLVSNLVHLTLSQCTHAMIESMNMPMATHLHV